MRVAVYQVTSSYAIGGCESYTWNLCHYLGRRGHLCHLIAGLVDKPRLLYPDVQLRMAPFVAREKIPDLGSRFRKLGERLSFGWHARQFVLAGRYDILNIHKPYDIPAALWFRRKTGCRIVWRCHGTDFYPGLRRLINQVDAIYCVSNYARESLAAMYPVHADVIYTGVDTGFFDPALVTRTRGQTPQLIYFGRYEGWKGVRYLVEALSQLRDLPWVARLVGEGPERENLVRQIAELQLTDRIHIEPAVADRERVRQLLARSDIAVFPAVGVETFSNAVLEAMSMETAVVATRVGGFVEAIGHETTGLLTEPKSPASLSAALRQLLIDPIRRQRLGQGARRRVVAQFDAADSFNKVETLFDRVARGRAPTTMMPTNPPVQ